MASASVDQFRQLGWCENVEASGETTNIYRSAADAAPASMRAPQACSFSPLTNNNVSHSRASSMHLTQCLDPPSTGRRLPSEFPDYKQAASIRSYGRCHSSARRRESAHVPLWEADCFALHHSYGGSGKRRRARKYAKQLTGINRVGPISQLVRGKATRPDCSPDRRPGDTDGSRRAAECVHRT
jgi:hypothetical protein